MPATLGRAGAARARSPQGWSGRQLEALAAAGLEEVDEPFELDPEDEEPESEPPEVPVDVLAAAGFAEESLDDEPDLLSVR
jgi:hypothetical protein